jgi:hypothetical protein
MNCRALIATGAMTAQAAFIFNWFSADIKSYNF